MKVELVKGKWYAYTSSGGFCIGKTKSEAIANALAANLYLTRGVHGDYNTRGGRIAGV